MHQYRLSRLVVAVSLSVAATSAFAGSQNALSARSFSMGGTGVAIAHPSSATSINPAMLAADHHEWSDDFGLALPSFNVRLADEEEVINQVDDIQDEIDRFDALVSSIQTLSPSQQNTDALASSAIDLRGRLVNFDKDTIRANLGLGLALAVPGKTLAVGFFTNASLNATVRGELASGDSALLDTIVSAAQTGDSAATQAAIDAAPTDSDGNIRFNSRGRILASAVGEFGISFAHEFNLENGNALQLGVSPKYVELRTFQYSESVAGFDDNDFDGDAYQTDKSGFNLDIGAAYEFGEDKKWNAGIAVKNLIPMELDSAASRPALGENIRTFKLDPTATLGIAHRSEFHVVTAEIDLTEKQAFGFEDDTQWLALGAEFDAWRYTQLRAGVRHNLASNNDNKGIEEKTQFTAGLGLNLAGARLDLGALYSDADLGAAIELGVAF